MMNSVEDELEIHIEEFNEYLKSCKLFIRNGNYEKAKKMFERTQQQFTVLQTDYEFQVSQGSEKNDPQLKQNKRKIRKLKQLMNNCQEEIEAMEQIQDDDHKIEYIIKHDDAAEIQIIEHNFETKIKLQKLDEAVEIAKETTNVLEQVRKMNEDTIQIGANAAEMLKKQTQKMQEIQENLNEIGAGLKRAKREANTMFRTIFCDKCILLVIIASLLVFGVLVVLRVVFPNSFSQQNIQNWLNNRGNNTITAK